MSSPALFVLLAALALSGAALVRREAPDALQQLQKNADEFANTFREQIDALMNSKSSQQLNSALKESSDAIMQQVSAFSGSLQGALKDADQKTQTALAETRDKLKAIGEKLRADHPDVEQNAEALRQRIASAVDATLTHSRDLAKKVADNVEQNNQALAPKLKEAYDDFVKRAQTVQKNLHDAAQKQ